MMIALAASVLLTVNTPAALAAQTTAEPELVTESCLTNGKPVTEENVLELLRQIQQDWPANTIWGTSKTPGTHKNEVSSTESGRVMRSYRVSNTYGCGAYASMVSSLLFGDTANPARRLEDLSQIRPGDILVYVRNDSGKVWHVTAALETPNEGWAFDGGTVSMDRQTNRLQVYFDEKPDRDTCSAMRHSGFRWAPSVGAWQRQLNDNAIWAAKQLDFLRPLTVEQTEPVPEPPQKASGGWNFYIIADLKTWADNAENRSPLEHFPSFEEAKARFTELRGESYNSEAVEPDPDGRSPARLTLGLESADAGEAGPRPKERLPLEEVICSTLIYV